MTWQPVRWALWMNCLTCSLVKSKKAKVRQDLSGKHLMNIYLFSYYQLSTLESINSIDKIFAMLKNHYIYIPTIVYIIYILICQVVDSLMI